MDLGTLISGWEHLKFAGWNHPAVMPKGKSR